MEVVRRDINQRAIKLVEVPPSVVYNIVPEEPISSLKVIQVFSVLWENVELTNLLVGLPKLQRLLEVQLIIKDWTKRLRTPYIYNTPLTTGNWPNRAFLQASYSWRELNWARRISARVLFPRIRVEQQMKNWAGFFNNR